jgi:undecaprenyl-diphosphatase
MIYLTDSGGVAANFLVAIIGALWQNATKQRFLAVAWLLIALGGGVMNVVTKHSFDRDRPPEALRDRAVLETNKSYPSGHSMGSAVSYTMLGYVLLQTQRSRAWSLITIVALACVIAAVGFSRIYLRAHWCSDVVGGWTIGLCWVFFCIGLLEIRRRMSVD